MPLPILKKKKKKTARKKLELEGDLLFLWVGRLDANKDPSTVVQAFIAFLTTHPKARLYMIFQQNGQEKELRKIIEKATVANNIHLIGKIDHAQLATWYSAMDFIISGSHSEGGGIAVLEAMSCGAIPILTKIPSFIKMTDNGKWGLLYEAGNREALYSLLLLTPSMDVETISHKVQERFRSEFSFQAIADKIEAIIQDEKR